MSIAGVPMPVPAAQPVPDPRWTEEPLRDLCALHPTLVEQVAALGWTPPAIHQAGVHLARQMEALPRGSRGSWLLADLRAWMQAMPVATAVNWLEAEWTLAEATEFVEQGLGPADAEVRLLAALRPGLTPTPVVWRQLPIGQYLTRWWVTDWA